MLRSIDWLIDWLTDWPGTRHTVVGSFIFVGTSRLQLSLDTRFRNSHPWIESEILFQLLSAAAPPFTHEKPLGKLTCDQMCCVFSALLPNTSLSSSQQPNEPKIHCNTCMRKSKGWMQNVWKKSWVWTFVIERWIKNNLRHGESNPGLPRDRRGY